MGHYWRFVNKEAQKEDAANAMGDLSSGSIWDGIEGKETSGK